MLPIKISRTATLLLNDFNNLLKHISERVFPYFKGRYYYKNLSSKATSSNLIGMKSVSESLGQLCSMISISVIGKWFELREGFQIPQSMCGGGREKRRGRLQAEICLWVDSFPKGENERNLSKARRKMISLNPSLQLII